MTEDIGLFEAIYTQRAIRYFKPDPVPDEMIRRLIEAATKAPSGADRQPWKFLVIKDSETKRGIAEYYRRTFEEVYGSTATSPRPISKRMMESGSHIAQHIHEVPVMILACVEHDGSPSSMDRGASIFPAVQNLLLAARGLGLGALITNNHKHYEDEVKQLLGIPDNVETAALIPIGYLADGASYGPTRRRPVDEVTYWETWVNK